MDNARILPFRRPDRKVPMTPPFCPRHGTWHPDGECARVDALRSAAAPLTVEQLRLPTDVDHALGCVACGAAVAETDAFCYPCEATIRFAEHTGNHSGLTPRQRDVLGLNEGEPT